MNQLSQVRVSAVRLIALSLFIVSLVPIGGCRLCADCGELDYPTYGGAWQRTRRDGGRVGSIFDPGGAKASELVNRDMPRDPQELERERQEQRGDQMSEPDDEARGESPADDEEMELEETQDDLRDKTLEDIDAGEGSDELRNKTLDEINIRIVPGQPLPPILE